MYYPFRRNNPTDADDFLAALIDAAEGLDPALAAWIKRKRANLLPVVATKLKARQERRAASEAADPSRGIHPQAVPRTSIDSNKWYTLWQRVGDGWVVERSFGGAHVKGDDSYWTGIVERAGSSRPLAFFDEGFNPNNNGGQEQDAPAHTLSALPAGFESFGFDDAPAHETALSRLTDHLGLGPPQLISAQNLLKGTGLNQLKEPMIHYFYKKRHASDIERAWAVTVKGTTSTQAKMAGNRVRKHLLSRRMTATDQPHLHDLPLYVIYGDEWLLSPAGAPAPAPTPKGSKTEARALIAAIEAVSVTGDDEAAEALLSTASKYAIDEATRYFRISMTDYRTPFDGLQGTIDAMHTAWEEQQDYRPAAKPVTPQHHGPMTAKLPEPIRPDVSKMAKLAAFSAGRFDAYIVDNGDNWFVSAIDRDSGAAFFQVKLPKDKWPNREAVLHYLSVTRKLGRVDPPEAEPMREAIAIPSRAIAAASRDAERRAGGQQTMTLPEALGWLQDSMDALAMLPPPGTGAWKDDQGFSAATNSSGRRWLLHAEDMGGAHNLPMPLNLAGIEILRAHSNTQLGRDAWEAAHAVISASTPMDAEQAKAMLRVKPGSNKSRGDTEKDGSWEWKGDGLVIQTPRRRSFSLKYADIEAAGFKPRTEVAWRKDRSTGEFSLWVAPHVVQRFAAWISDAYPALAAAMLTWAPVWVNEAEKAGTSAPEPTRTSAPEPTRTVDLDALDPHEGNVQGVRWEWSEGDRGRLLLLLPSRDTGFAVGDVVTAQNAYRGSYPNTEYWRAFDSQDVEKIAEVVGSQRFRLTDAAAALRKLAPIWSHVPQVSATEQKDRERRARMLARRFRHSMSQGTNMDTVQSALVEAWPLVARIEPGATGTDMGAWGSWQIVQRRARGKMQEKLRVFNPWALGGKDWVAQIPGKKGGKDGGTFYWEFPIKRTPMVARALDDHNPPLAMSLRLGILIEQIGGADRDCATLEELASAKTVSDIVEPDVRKKVETINRAIRWPRGLRPHPYQRVGIAYAVLSGGRALIGDAMGLGKTIQAIGFLLHDLARTTPAVVVCPNGAKGNWVRELDKWSGGQITPVRVDSSRDRVSAPGPGIVYVVGWGLLPRITGRLLSTLKPLSVVYDESHYAKTWGIGRSEAAQVLSKQVAHVILLSGTPMPNRPSELGHQMHMLDPDTFPTKRVFDARFAGGTTVIRQGREIWDDRGASNLGELSDLLRCYMVRRTKTEVGIELPDKTRTLLVAEFGAAEWKAYANIENNVDKAICASWRRRSIERARKIVADGASPTAAVREVNADPPDAKMLAKLAIVQLGYLRRGVAELKVPAAIDWILSFVAGGRPALQWTPLVVFAEHRATIDAISVALDKAKVPYGLFVGWVSDKAKDQTVLDFMAGRTTIVLATQAMREAVTLTRASDMLFVERWWVPSYEEQAEDRIHRISQKNAVNIRYLMAPGTVDDHIGALVDSKRELVEQVMRGETITQGEAAAARAQEGLAMATMRGIAARLQAGGECAITVADL